MEFYLKPFESTVELEKLIKFVDRSSNIPQPTYDLYTDEDAESIEDFILSFPTPTIAMGARKQSNASIVTVNSMDSSSSKLMNTAMLHRISAETLCSPETKSHACPWELSNLNVDESFIDGGSKDDVNGGFNKSARRRRNGKKSTPISFRRLSRMFHFTL
jgi:hypothetical protein